jgi:hypothetical protein
MALHNLKITVVDGGKIDRGGLFGGKPPGDGEGEKATGGNSKFYKVMNFNQTIKNKIKQATSPATLYAINTGISLATQTARQFVNYYVSDIGRRNGDSNYQAIVNRRIEVATDVLSVGQGALSGAGAGAMFGPIGAAVGAIAGAASSGINLGFKYAERERAYAHEMFKEENSQAYNLARANYSIWTGRQR